MAYRIIHEKSIATFIIRIFGKMTEEEVAQCFQEYDKMIEENFDGKRFNVIINVDEEAHSSIIVLKQIRHSLQNQPHRESLANIVAVNENPMTVAARNASPSANMLPFFISEEEAKRYLRVMGQ